MNVAEFEGYIRSERLVLKLINDNEIKNVRSISCGYGNASVVVVEFPSSVHTKTRDALLALIDGTVILDHPNNMQDSSCVTLVLACTE